jgi:hypothetical protein
VSDNYDPDPFKALGYHGPKDRDRTVPLASLHGLTEVPAKRKQRGGVRKGKSWTREALGALRVAGLLGRQRARNEYLGHALYIIYAHARAPETRQEALELLGVLEKRG